MMLRIQPSSLGIGHASKVDRVRSKATVQALRCPRASSSPARPCSILPMTALKLLGLHKQGQSLPALLGAFSIGLLFPPFVQALLAHRAVTLGQFLDNFRGHALKLIEMLDLVERLKATLLVHRRVAFFAVHPTTLCLTQKSPVDVSHSIAPCKSAPYHLGPRWDAGTSDENRRYSHIPLETVGADCNGRPRSSALRSRIATSSALRDARAIRQG